MFLCHLNRYLTLVLLICGKQTYSNNNWYNCPDNEYSCISADCSAELAAKRSKIICDSFPFYAGSLNLYNYQSKWSLVSQTLSTCNNPSDTNSSTPYCHSWTQFEDINPTECKCTQVSISSFPKNKYCISWECHYIHHNQISSKCDCIINNNDISFCQSWICNDTNIINNDDNQETMTYRIMKYNCLSHVPQNINNANNANNAFYAEYIHFQNITGHSFCWNWIGNTLKIEHEQTNWSITNCECEIPNIQIENDEIVNAYCDLWMCYSKSMDYYNNDQLQFYLSWIIASFVGILICILRYAAFKLDIVKRHKYYFIFKLISNILVVLALLTLLFWAFIYGSTLSTLITVMIWKITCALCIFGIALRRYLKKKENEQLQKTRYEFQRERDQYFPRAPTRNSFRYSFTDSETEFYF